MHKECIVKRNAMHNNTERGRREGSRELSVRGTAVKRAGISFISTISYRI